MIRRQRLAALLIALSFSVVVAYAASPSGPKQKGRNIETAVSTHKDAIMRVEAVNTAAGITVGFRVEVINPRTDKDLVLKVRESVSSMFDVRLIDAKKMTYLWYGPSSTSTEKYRYDIVLPRTGHARFVPVPAQVLIDPRKPITGENLKRTPKGEYVVEVLVVLEYCVLDKGTDPMPKYGKLPEFKTLKLNMPRLAVYLDTEQAVSEDPLKTYVTYEKNVMISRSGAVDIARKLIKGTVSYDKNLPVDVKLKDGRYRVTFPVSLPKGTRGPDYAARVTIDGMSGKVLKALSGS